MTNTSAVKERNGEEPAGYRGCAHCGDPTDTRTAVEAGDLRFCCTGCRAVYEILNTLGLDDYYKIRAAQNIPGSAPAQDPGSAEDYSYLDQKSFMDLYTAEESPLTMNFYVEGIECAACLWLIEKIPSCAEGIESVSLNMSDNTASVTFTPDKKFSSFPDAVKRFGYRAHPLKPGEDTDDLRKKENRRSLIRLAVAAVCAGNIMLLSAAVYAGAGGVFEKYFTLVSFMLSIPVVTYCSLPFYRSVAGALRSGRVTVDIPVVFVILAGFGLSAHNFFAGSSAVYFDSITAFVFLLLGSRYFLKSVRGRLSEREQPGKTFFSLNRVLVWDGKARQFFYEPIESLKTGSRIKLSRGERIPADGGLVSHTAEINLAVLTGENIPRTIEKGDDVFAGSILESDEAVLKVLSTGKSTRIGKILDDVERSYAGKISLSGAGDRYAAVFTLAVGVISITAFFAISYLYGMQQGIERVMAFILIACPCAFVFVLPLFHSMSLKSAAGRGILIRDPGIFDKLPGVKNVFFDKTGTLTNGVFRILKWDTGSLDDRDLGAILAIEKKSDHPIARAIVSRLAGTDLPVPEVTGFEHIYTKGVSAEAWGSVYTITSGDSRTPAANEVNELITSTITVRKDGEPISEIMLGDSLKEDAKFAVRELAGAGYGVFIVSGDKGENVKQVAERINVPRENIFFGETPEGKSEIISRHGCSMMIGDGLNDAPALASADVGVAIQGSVGESMKVSDAYILNNDLFTILDLIGLGTAARATAKRNIVLSISYNSIAGAFALAGYITPLAAAVLMPAVSLLLLGSALVGTAARAGDKRRDAA